jgi:hypothetical protein
MGQEQEMTKRSHERPVTANDGYKDTIGNVDASDDVVNGEIEPEDFADNVAEAGRRPRVAITRTELASSRTSLRTLSLVAKQHCVVPRRQVEGC